MWFDTIAQLPFYDSSQPCYCEILAVPQDMILQGSFPIVNQITGYQILLKSPNGLIEYEDVSAYFDIYYFQYNGMYFFNARLNRFTPQMCVEKCWILEVIINTDTLGAAFDKYTQRYCTAQCCEVPTGISTSQDDVTDPTLPTTPTDRLNNIYTDDCGNKIIRLISRFPCYDAFSGIFYGTPDIIIGGSASFEYTKITSFVGRFVQRPREITRQISYNCKLQRAESNRVYLLEGYELFPMWKVEEIENQLHAPYIWVETENSYNEYQFSGGTAFEKADGALDCTEIFKLSVALQDCTTRQIFGCGDSCNNSNYDGYNAFYVIPANYNGGYFYSDNKEAIAGDLYGFMDWLISQDGIYAADLLVIGSTPSPALSPLPSPLPCSVDYVIGVRGTSYIPNSVYFDAPVAANKIYTKNIADLSDVCDTPVNSCAIPVAGTITDTPSDCPVPVAGTVTDTVITPNSVDLIQYIPDNWYLVLSGSPATPEDTSATVYNNQVTFNLKVRKDEYAGIDDDYQISNEVIGIIGTNGRPSSLRIMTSENNGTLNSTQIITVDEFGVIRYSGEPTSVSLGSYAETLLTNIVFNL